MKRSSGMGPSVVGAITLLILSVTMLEFGSKVDGSEEACLYSNRDTCYMKGCEWCHSLKGCYRRDQARLLGSNCHRSMSRQLTQEIDCVGIALKNECLRPSHCRWCTSEHIDDACFNASEAWKLPRQIFSCSK